MTLRSSDGDHLRARQRLERALSSVDWAPPGLAPHAILVVRRVAVKAGSHASEPRFSARVSLALQRWTARARRPWIDVDAAHADAVMFTDEAELVACLIRDWLRGVVADRWWWQPILGTLNADAWLRERVLPRGDIVVSALRLLTPRSDVVSWIGCLDDGEAAGATTSIAPAFAVYTGERPSSMRTEGTLTERQEDAAEAQGSVDITGEEAGAIARLIEIAPEIRTLSVGRAQRRLLALVCVLTRAPSWARSPELAMALTMLDRVDVERLPAISDPSARTPASPRVSQPPVNAALDQKQTGPIDSPTTTVRGSEEADCVVQARGDESPQGRAVRARSHPAPDSPEASSTTRTRRTNAPVDDRLTIAIGPNGDIEPTGDVPAVVVAKCESETHTSTLAFHAEARVAPPREHIRRMDTQYGGIFYLLNVWLALGVYADFTAPRGKNFVLSPWDLLALVGCWWFGPSFVADPVWTALADLAVRGPDEDPGRGVELPDGWLPQHIEMVKARLHQALDAEDPRAIPAFVCCYRAVIEITAASVDVHLALADLPLDIRIAGLDRDPGWIPAAGRAVWFHFA